MSVSLLLFQASMKFLWWNDYGIGYISFQQTCKHAILLVSNETSTVIRVSKCNTVILWCKEGALGLIFIKIAAYSKLRSTVEPNHKFLCTITWICLNNSCCTAPLILISWQMECNLNKKDVQFRPILFPIHTAVFIKWFY